MRQADCHYGNALRDEEEGLSSEDAARKRDEVRVDRVIDLRRGVHMGALGEHSQNKAQAGHEDGFCGHFYTLKGACRWDYGAIFKHGSRKYSTSLVCERPRNL